MHSGSIVKANKVFVLAIVFALSSVSFLTFAYWWTNAAVLPASYGAKINTDPLPWSTDSVWVAEVTVPGSFPEQGELTLKAVTVKLDKDLATSASVRVKRCTVVTKPNGQMLSVGFQAALPSSEHQCADALQGTKLGKDDQLVVFLNPEKPGKYKLISATVSYHLGSEALWRSGKETIKLNASVSFTK